MIKTYTLVRKIADTARAIILLSPGVIGPHGKCWEEREKPAESDPHLYLFSAGSVSVGHGEPDGKQPVDVDEDKVVDGTTEEDDNAAGDQLAHELPHRPSSDPESVEWNDHPTK